MPELLTLEAKGEAGESHGRSRSGDQEGVNQAR